MRAYRDTWVALAGTAGGTGVGVALVLIGPSAVTRLFVVGGLLGSSAVWMFCELRGRPRMARPWWGGAFAGGTLVALTGLTQVSTTLTWVAAAALAASSPWVVRTCSGACRRRGLGGTAHRDGTATGAGHVPGATHDPDLDVDPVPSRTAADLSDAELAHAWHQSYAVLQDSLSPTARMSVVLLRAEYLAEIETRDPRGVAAWLANEPRPAADVSKYLFRRHEGPSTGCAHPSA